MSQLLMEPVDLLKDSKGRLKVVGEKETVRITGTLTDEAGAAVPLAQITTLTLTIHARDLTNEPIVNSVENINILNTGRATIHATNGSFTLTLEPNDNSLVDETAALLVGGLEWHEVLIQGTYGGGKRMNQRIQFPVRRVPKVT